MACVVWDIWSSSLISLLVYSLWKLRHLQVIRDGISCISGHWRKLRCLWWWSSVLRVLFRCRILKFEDKVLLRSQSSRTFALLGESCLNFTVEYITSSGGSWWPERLGETCLSSRGGRQQRAGAGSGGVVLKHKSWGNRFHKILASYLPPEL